MAPGELRRKSLPGSRCHLVILSGSFSWRGTVGIVLCIRPLVRSTPRTPRWLAQLSVLQFACSALPPVLSVPSPSHLPSLKHPHSPSLQENNPFQKEIAACGPHGSALAFMQAIEDISMALQAICALLDASNHHRLHRLGYQCLAACIARPCKLMGQKQSLQPRLQKTLSTSEVLCNVCVTSSFLRGFCILSG